MLPINCPLCKTSNNYSAVKCRLCGENLFGESKPKTNPVVTGAYTLLIVCLLIFGVFAAVIGLTIYYLNP